MSSKSQNEIDSLVGNEVVGTPSAENSPAMPSRYYQLNEGTAAEPDHHSRRSARENRCRSLLDADNPEIELIAISRATSRLLEN